MRDSNGVMAIRTLVFVKAKLSGTAIKDFINIPRDSIADKFVVFFIKALPVIVML